MINIRKAFGFCGQQKIYYYAPATFFPLFGIHII